MNFKPYIFVGGLSASIFLLGFCTRPETVREVKEVVTKEGVPVPYLQCFSIQYQNPETVRAEEWPYDEYDEDERLTRHTIKEPARRPKEVPSDAVWQPAFYAEGAWRSGGLWEESAASVKRRQEASDKKWESSARPMIRVGCPDYVEKAFNERKVDYDDLARAADKMSDFSWNLVTLEPERSKELNDLLASLRASLGHFNDSQNRAP